MKYTPQLAYSIGDHLSKRGIDSTRDTFSPIFDGLEGDDLVEAVGFLYSHGFSRSVIGSLFEDTPAATVLYAIKKSKATPPDNVTGLDGRAQRNAPGPGRPFACRDDLLVKDLEKVVHRLTAFHKAEEPISSEATALLGKAARLVREVSRHEVS